MQPAVGKFLGNICQRNQLIRRNVAKRDLGPKHMHADLPLSIYAPRQAVVLEAVLIFLPSLVRINAVRELLNIRPVGGIEVVEIDIFAGSHVQNYPSSRT